MCIRFAAYGNGDLSDKSIRVYGNRPKFKLGVFVVMPNVYKNIKLIHRRTGKCPTLFGPVLMHQTITES